MKREEQPRLLVLVAEHSLPMRAQLRASLNQEPGVCVCAEAETGAAALELFVRYRPDVVLLNVSLPDRSGFEVLQCMKQTSPGCAIILLSNSPDPFVEYVGRVVGAIEVCHKTRDFGRVREILRGLAGERSVREREPA